MSKELMIQQTAAEISSSQLFLDNVIALSRLEQTVPTIKVRDGESKAIAAEALAQVKKTDKDLEAMRKSANAPYLKMKGVIDSIFRPFAVSTQKLKAHLEPQIVEYTEKEREKYEKSQKEAMEKEITAKNIDETEAKAEMMQPSNTVETDSGTSYVQKRWTFEVIDVVKLAKAAIDGRTRVPLNVIMENEPALRQQVNAGIYKPSKWAKFGVKVEEVGKVVTRT